MAATKNGALKLEDGRKLKLVGVQEAAAIVNVERSRFARWLTPLRKWRKGGRRGEMPKLAIPMPLADLACGPVWLEDDMKRFAKSFASRRHAGAPE